MQIPIFGIAYFKHVHKGFRDVFYTFKILMRSYMLVTEMSEEEKLSSKEIKEAKFIDMKELYRNVTHQNTIKGKVAPDILSYSKFQRKFKMRGKETKMYLNLTSLKTIKIKNL